MFIMSIVPQVREINSTLIQNRVDSYIFYSHVTHYTLIYKSLFSNIPQALNFQQGRSKNMFLSVFINSCIHTVCHVLPRDCQHKTSEHLVMASNCMKTESTTWRKKKCARTLVYILSCHFTNTIFTKWDRSAAAYASCLQMLSGHQWWLPCHLTS